VHPKLLIKILKHFLLSADLGATKPDLPGVMQKQCESHKTLNYSVTQIVIEKGRKV
jgi:hypothetical protein